MGSNSRTEEPKLPRHRQAIRVSHSPKAEPTVEGVTVTVEDTIVALSQQDLKWRRLKFEERSMVELSYEISVASQPTSDLSASAVRERMQSVEARQAMLDAFNASPDELGEAAVALAARTGASRKQPL